MKSDAFLQELAIMKNVEGKATGKLILGESLRDVNTRVEVGAFELSGDYARIPYRIDLKGESFLFDERMISTSGFSGSFGKTSFSRINLLYRWGEQHYMEITARQQGAKISIDEVHPLLRGVEKNRGIQRPFDVVKGTLSLDALDFKGSILYPKEWVSPAGKRRRRVSDGVSRGHSTSSGAASKATRKPSCSRTARPFQDASVPFPAKPQGIHGKASAPGLDFPGYRGRRRIGLSTTCRPSATYRTPAVASPTLTWCGKSAAKHSSKRQVPTGAACVHELERIRAKSTSGG